MRLGDLDALYDCAEARYRLSSGEEHKAERALLDAICDSPTIDAIPMWWITEKFLDVLNKDKELSKAVWLVRKAWQQEQEAQDG